MATPASYVSLADQPLSRILAKQSLQYTGRSVLGSGGTFASPPQAAQVAVKYSRGHGRRSCERVTAGLAALRLVLGNHAQRRTPAHRR